IEGECGFLALTHTGASPLGHHRLDPGLVGGGLAGLPPERIPHYAALLMRVYSQRPLQADLGYPDPQEAELDAARDRVAAALSAGDHVRAEKLASELGARLIRQRPGWLRGGASNGQETYSEEQGESSYAAAETAEEQDYSSYAAAETAEAQAEESVEQQIDRYREENDVAARRNVAMAYYDINGWTGRVFATSGTQARRNSFVSPMPDNLRFRHHSSRPADAEAKVLEGLAENLTAESTGWIRLYSEARVCRSCRGVIQQFRELFPLIDLEYSDLGR
ncbi:deaminase domain-containing protein, partial [Amycolatopsis sp. NPDC059090]|uniref:deaminase domain-containing protein n=1 Tax=Amycolatopsis sp. NPDC059090 TaxID=3346723 RepID=UPI0036726E06